MADWPVLVRARQSPRSGVRSGGCGLDRAATEASRLQKLIALLDSGEADDWTP